MLLDSVHTIDPITNRLLDNGVANQQFLILGVVLAVVWFLLNAMFVYYMFQFIKTKSDKKLYGRGMLYANLVLSIFELVDWILVIAFWCNGKPFNGNGQQDYNTLVALVVIGFILLVAAIIMMWFFLPYYGIAFDGKRILFMGEDIPYQSITKIISDDETGATYINYTRGKRSHKRLKFSAASAFGLFIKKNASETGHSVEQANEKEYYQSLMNSDKLAEKQFSKQVDNKIKNKSARTTSTTSKSKSKSTSSKSKSKNK